MVKDILTGDMLELFKRLSDKGFEVDENGVVTAVGNMVDLYWELYKEMRETAERTTQDLNTAFAKLLTAKD